MQVIFIHHSCFLVEVDDLVLIFDYFGGDRVNGFHFTGKIPDYAPDTKSICLPATNIRIILTWIFCAGVKNIPMYIIFYPRISASVRIFCKSMELTRGAEKSDVCLRKQPL